MPEALGSAGAPALNSTSTPALEVQNGSGSTPIHNRTTPWADGFLSNYKKIIIWPDEEDGIEGGSSKLFSILESTHEHTPPGILPKGNS